ncbi:MAG: hypothetical protein ACP5LN_04470 [Thermoproteota archaeon]
MSSVISKEIFDYNPWLFNGNIRSLIACVDLVEEEKQFNEGSPAQALRLNQRKL